MTEVVRSEVHRWHDFEDGKFIFGGTQDVEPILDDNKDSQNKTPVRGQDFRRIASIPVVIIERWIAETGHNLISMPKREFDQLIRRKLRDPSWKWLRTTSARI